MEDFLLFDQDLSDTECLVQKSVRAFVEQTCLPVMARCYEKAEFPKQWIQKMADLGLFGINVPQSDGGLGANYLTYGLVCRELERGDTGLRSTVSVQNSLCIYPIWRYGSQAQKEYYLPKLIKGEYVGCFGLTEPNAGSDPASMQTTATKVQGGFRLNGSKLWITNASIADIAIVWANTKNGVRGFIVKTDTPGLTTNDIHQKMSLRASVTGELVFEDCFVSEDQMLPGSDIGLGAPLSCLTQARYGIAWGAQGAAEVCYETALSYVKDRKQFDKPLASCQLVQKTLVEMLNEIVKMHGFNKQLAALKETGQSNFAMVSLAKMNAAGVALDIARQARNLLGANGISLEYTVIRHMMNLESVFTYEGTDNIHHLIVGRYITGASAF